MCDDGDDDDDDDADSASHSFQHTQPPDFLTYFFMFPPAPLAVVLAVLLAVLVALAASWLYNA